LGMTLFFQALDYDLPLYTGIAVLAAVNISGLMHLTPGNIGIYEAAGALVLSVYGLGYAEAILIMVVLHLAVIATIGVYGFISGFLLYLKGYELGQDYEKLKSENS